MRKGKWKMEDIHFFRKMTAAQKKEYLQRCARGIYAEELEKNGFANYNRENLSWYRVVNNEVLQTVYIYIQYNDVVPLLMEIGYGFHPLFIPAPIPNRVIRHAFWSDEVMMTAYWEAPRCVYDEKTPVLCYKTPGRGREILEKIFSEFRKIKTETDAYKLHKNMQIRRAEMTDGVKWEGKTPIYGSEWIIDEAIYFDDKDIYDVLVKQLNNQHCHLQKNCTTNREMAFLKRWEFQIDAMQNGKREEFLCMLENRRKKLIRDLDKKLGLKVK